MNMMNNPAWGGRGQRGGGRSGDGRTGDGRGGRGRGAAGFVGGRSGPGHPGDRMEGAGRGPGAGHGGRGGHGGRSGRDDGSGGGRSPRLFEQGNLKLLSLHLLAQRPCHGYELIKAIEALVGGDYSPSPGTIYPTLTWLTEVGHASAADSDGGRKQYTITEAGQQHLVERQGELARLLGRLSATRSMAGARGAPEIQRAMGNLKIALQLRFGQGTAPDAMLIRRVAEVLDKAAVEIERL